MSVVSCPPNTPPTTGVVVFEPAVFKTSYPEFVTVTDAALNLNFSLASLILSNTCRSAVVDAHVRETLLYLLVAHITALRNGVNGAPAQGIIGRIDSATEGSVTVSAEFLLMSNAQAWYVQTQYGAMYWQMTASYRTMHYVPAPQSCGPGGFNVGGMWPGNRGCGC